MNTLLVTLWVRQVPSKIYAMGFPELCVQGVGTNRAWVYHILIFKTRDNSLPTPPMLVIIIDNDASHMSRALDQTNRGFSHSSCKRAEVLRIMHAVCPWISFANSCPSGLDIEPKASTVFS